MTVTLPSVAPPPGRAETQNLHPDQRATVRPYEVG